ncbi:MAG: DUF4198 domain-containing protein [Deltaproteobacteria bacterium]|jgi:uncharacterized GH25 family protein|nr:DUF4198 domain-containing protein [Deltaproteobacteria bacterium]
MKVKIFILALSLLSLGFSTQILAHDLWVEAVKPQVNQKLSVAFGYGHGFPVSDEIKSDDIPEHFLPPKLFGDNGEIPLASGQSTTDYISAENLPTGNYVVTDETPSRFYGRASSGWVYKNRTEDPELKSCGNFFMYSKEAFILGQAKYSGLAAKPIGQKLEFVPQADPSKIKVGQPFPVKVLYNGQPLRGGVVSAILAGVVKDNATIFFQATTNQEGVVNIIAFKSGDWLARVLVEEDYPDKKVCDKYEYSASYTFRVID